MLPTDKQARKERPIASGVMSYFPDAIAEVAHVSYVGNQQHNPGQPMHWARHKSTDHADCIARHLTERGTIDDDGMRHSAKAAWRALALLQLELEETGVADMNGKFHHKPPLGTTPSYITDKVEFVPMEHVSRDVHEVTLPETEALNDWLIARDRVSEIDPLGLMDAEDYIRAHNREHLKALGCLPHVANQITGGISYHDRPELLDRYVYIAGPMRGYPEFNFPAFDAARDAALRNGWIVISPADIDRADGVKEKDHSTGDATPFDQRVFVYRDFYALYLIAHTEGGAIAMLPGWEKSTGAVAEFFLARWLGLKLLDARSGQKLDLFDHTALFETVSAYVNSQEK